MAVPNERIANILFDAIDDLLTFPLKRMGKVTLFNGIDVLQTRHYIKISVETYISRVCEKHLASWMDMGQCPTYMTPLPNKPSFMKLFLSSIGNPDEKHQRELAKKMGFGFRNGLGEIIYAMITARPDIAYAIVRAAQHSACPHEIHYNVLHHLFKYMYQTRTQGIYY